MTEDDGIKKFIEEERRHLKEEHKYPSVKGSGMSTYLLSEAYKVTKGKPRLLPPAPPSYKRIEIKSCDSCKHDASRLGDPWCKLHKFMNDCFGYCDDYEDKYLRS